MLTQANIGRNITKRLFVICRLSNIDHFKDQCQRFHAYMLYTLTRKKKGKSNTENTTSKIVFFLIIKNRSIQSSFFSSTVSRLLFTFNSYSLDSSLAGIDCNPDSRNENRIADIASCVERRKTTNSLPGTSSSTIRSTVSRVCETSRPS